MAKVNSGDWRRWRELIQRQQASGQSIESFCIKEKLGQSSFYAWKRRLRENRGRAARTPAKKELVPVQIVNDQPVSIVNDRPASAVSDWPDDRPVSAANLEVQWPDGTLLRVQGCEVRMLKAVVATISASSKHRRQPC